MKMKRWFLLGLSAVLVFVLLGWFGTIRAQNGTENEVLYLADSAAGNDWTSVIYTVDLNADGNAYLTEFLYLGKNAAYEGDPGWNNVDVLAASPDGNFLYFIDNSASAIDTNRLGRYDITTDTIEVLYTFHQGFETDQGAIAPDGTFYITENSDEKLYWINLTVSEPTVNPIDYIKLWDGANVLGKINCQGGDIAFGADGTFYMVTYKPPMTLYHLTNYDPDTRDALLPVLATFQGTCLESGSFNGLAVRDNGEGDLVASSPTAENIRVLGKNDCTSGMIYPTYLGVSPFLLNNGDMTTGPLAICTKTIGYWKTHSWDDAVITICGVEIGEDSGPIIGYEEDGTTPIYLTGKDILWSARGNNFSMLFAQLIAAKLNTNNSIVGYTVIEDAETYICTEWEYRSDWPVHIYDSIPKPIKGYVSGLWDALDVFNNSYPCDEE
jgi:hypothetical protein